MKSYSNLINERQDGATSLPFSRETLRAYNTTAQMIRHDLSELLQFSNEEQDNIFHCISISIMLVGHQGISEQDFLELCQGFLSPKYKIRKQLVNQKNNFDQTPLDILLSDEVFSSIKDKANGKLAFNVLKTFLEIGADITQIGEEAQKNLLSLITSLENTDVELEIAVSLMAGSSEDMLHRAPEIKAFSVATHIARLNEEEIDEHKKKVIAYKQKLATQEVQTEDKKHAEMQPEQMSNELQRILYYNIIRLNSNREQALREFSKAVKFVANLERVSRGDRKAGDDFSALRYIADLSNHSKGEGIVISLLSDFFRGFKQHFDKNEVLNNVIFFVEKLANAGINLDKQDKYGHTALMCLFTRSGTRIDSNHLKEFLDIFLHYGANIEAKNKEGKTALIIASWNRHTKESVEKLLQNSANVNAQDGKGRTALMHHASVSHSGSIIEPLVKNGADLDAQDEKGVTALMFATANLNNDCVAALLQNGADINIKDSQGRDAIDYLLTHCIIENDISWGRNFLEIGDERYLEVIKLFIDQGCDLSDAQGLKILNFLAQHYQTHSVANNLRAKILIQHPLKYRLTAENLYIAGTYVLGGAFIGSSTIFVAAAVATASAAFLAPEFVIAGAVVAATAAAVAVVSYLCSTILSKIEQPITQYT